MVTEKETDGSDPNEPRATTFLTHADTGSGRAVRTITRRTRPSGPDMTRPVTVTDLGRGLRSIRHRCNAGFIRPKTLAVREDDDFIALIPDVVADLADVADVDGGEDVRGLLTDAATLGAGALMGDAETPFAFLRAGRAEAVAGLAPPPPFEIASATG